MKHLIAVVIAVLVLWAGSGWAGEWIPCAPVEGRHAPDYQVWVDDDFNPQVSIITRKPDCPYQIRTIPADEANEWLKKNPGWEPFGAIIADCMEGNTIEDCDYIYLRRRVCEGTP